MQAFNDCEEDSIDEQEEVNYLHFHCEQCIKVVSCSIKPTLNVSCEVVACKLDCGFRFHACKGSEHKLLCANEKVACINAGNGCPVVLVRNQQAQHLEKCPASVVVCNMVWNRRPSHTFDRLMWDRFYLLDLPEKFRGQLDVALALRDQRMLNKWVVPPPTMEEFMSYNIFCYFPCMPNINSNGIDEATNKCGTGTSIPIGLQKSICDELLKGTKIGVVDKLQEPNLSMRGSMAECSYDRNPNLRLCNMNDMLGNVAETSKKDCSKNIQSDNSLPKIEGNYRILSSKETDCNESLGVVFDGAYISNSLSTPMNSLSFPPSSPSIIFSIDVDLTLEYFARYQNKPSNLYTCLCTQEFRRDQYSWHYKNVHSDIHGGLNGWLEHRCPLAQYGCEYTMRRLHPSHKGACVIHSDILESFGIKPFVESDNSNTSALASSRDVMDETCVSSDEGVISSETVMSEELSGLCRLPSELLRHICHFLDSFSLCNLALTCHNLRGVCRSLLRERGIVVQQWRKKIVDSKTVWTVADKRWFFSTAFDPVHFWGFEDNDHMSNHLKNCTFSERNIISKPYFNYEGKEPNVAVRTKLKLTGCEED